MDSTTIIEQIDSSQAAHEVTANNLFDAASVAMAYGRHAEECAGLTWGYYGVRYGGTAWPNGTHACDASSVTYMVADLVTGEPSFVVLGESDDGLWDDDVNYGRCYKITTSGSAVASYEDHRFGPGGIFGAGGSTPGGSSSDSDTVIDGGLPDSTYGAITPIDGGAP